MLQTCTHEFEHCQYLLYLQFHQRTASRASSQFISHQISDFQWTDPFWYWIEVFCSNQQQITQNLESVWNNRQMWFLQIISCSSFKHQTWKYKQYVFNLDLQSISSFYAKY
jgi:hypothetical protein